MYILPKTLARIKGARHCLAVVKSKGESELCPRAIRKPRLSRWVTFLLSQPWRGSPLFNGVQCSQCFQTCFSVCGKLGASLRNSLCVDVIEGRNVPVLEAQTLHGTPASESQGMDLAPPGNAEGSERTPASVPRWVGR